MEDSKDCRLALKATFDLVEEKCSVSEDSEECEVALRAGMDLIGEKCQLIQTFEFYGMTVTLPAEIADIASSNPKLTREERALKHWLFTCPVLPCPRDPPSERLGCGPSDQISEPVRIGNMCFYVTLNRRLNYIGISTLEGPTRFFAQDEDATRFIQEYDDWGAERFVHEYDGCGFW